MGAPNQIKRLVDTFQNNLDAFKSLRVKTAIQCQTEATNKQIDRLVYKLYGLTEEEIKIVEESIR